MVGERRQRAADRLGIDHARVVWMHQVHGAQVAVVDAADVGRTVPAVDALVTTEVGLPLAVLVADCLPVVLVDERAGVLAVVHSGRRGLQQAVTSHALSAMQDLGAHLEHTRAWLGPSICGRCYEVPAQIQAAVSGVVPAASATTRWGTPALDLRAGLTAQLCALSVAIEAVGPCTVEDTAYYSYRRDGTAARFAGYGWLG